MEQTHDLQSSPELRQRVQTRSSPSFDRGRTQRPRAERRSESQSRATTQVETSVSKKSGTPENYVHLDCLNLPAGSTFSFTDTSDAKALISQEKSSSSRTVLEDYWVLMSAAQIREVERYQENGTDRFEFTEILNDFLSLVSD